MLLYRAHIIPIKFVCICVLLWVFPELFTIISGGKNIEFNQQKLSIH